MKKYSFILWAALTMTGVFTACTDNDTPMIEQVETKTVTIHATIDEAIGSRVALEDDVTNKVVNVTWKQNDAFKINVNGTDYIFKYTADNKFECDATDFPETFESAGTVTATYPAAPIVYTSQKGTLAGAESFLTMTATLYVTAGQSTENLALNFKHQSSIVKLTLKNDDFKGKSVTWVTLKNGDDAVATATQTFTGAADGSIQAYFVVEPQAMASTSILAVCEGSNYTVALTDNTLEAGKLYNVEKTMEKVTALMGTKTAAKAVKGDYAMADGSFISKDATLTDEQQANVRGIVFWTTADKNPATDAVTPASLRDDKIMNADFPNCTHGLILAIKNMGSQIRWQEVKTSVADYQINVFAADNKSDYKSIASGRGATDPGNYILGYQNTKLLKAYNASLTSGDPRRIVAHVDGLDAFALRNPAPAKTTGWFIPSIKELTLICGKDMDDVLNASSHYGTETVQLMNEILGKLPYTVGANKLSTSPGYHWSSTEYSEYVQAMFMGMNGEQKGQMYKGNQFNVRPVCAF